jgi:hypothetical protein
MPHFVNRSQRYFISTNYKVLYTLLYHQPQLQGAPKSRLAVNGWLKRWTPLPWQRHFLLVRDPYQRLESFYKDKFRLEPTLALRTYTELQYCQRLFCPYLQITQESEPALIREKLLSFSFAHFIQLLPELYLADGHLHPQAHISTLRWRGRTIQLQFDRVLKIESAPDLAYVQDALALDLSQTYNSTRQVAWSTPWRPDLRAVVNRLYKADFVAFAYAMQTT